MLSTDLSFVERDVRGMKKSDASLEMLLCGSELVIGFDNAASRTDRLISCAL